MVTRNTGENFRIVVSTKRTLPGADTAAFDVYYAPVDDPANVTRVAAQVEEVVRNVDDASAHTATTTAYARYGSRVLYVDGSASTVESGDVIEYASGMYAYVMKAVGDKLYLKTPLRADVPSGTSIKQVGNTGDYLTPLIAITQKGEYIVSVEASEYGILVGERVKVVDPTEQTVDTDAPAEAVAVAY